MANEDEPDIDLQDEPERRTSSDGVDLDLESFNARGLKPIVIKAPGGDEWEFHLRKITAADQLDMRGQSHSSVWDLIEDVLEEDSWKLMLELIEEHNPPSEFAQAFLEKCSERLAGNGNRAQRRRSSRSRGQRRGSGGR